MERQVFYKPEKIFKVVEKKVEELLSKYEIIDYLTFVSDGEPTLDINLGKEIALLKNMGIPIAVLTNASLIWLDHVREDLSEADVVSLKVDSVSEDVWKRVNRPHKDLNLTVVLEGMANFVKEFNGKVISETMLIDGVNYGDEIKKIAKFLCSLKKLYKAYIAIPTRPPMENWVYPAKKEVINTAVRIFSTELGKNRVECLVGDEGNAFASTGNLEKDLLSITAVHPMREKAVKSFLQNANADWQNIEKLLHEDKLRKIEYEGNIYYTRTLKTK